MNQLLRDLVPPLVWRALREVRSRPMPTEWEYVPEGWEAAKSDAKIKGWNVPGVLEAYKASWPGFVRRVETTAPLAVSPDAVPGSPADLAFHNSVMCFAYVLSASCRQKAAISMLDWGGGIGHYYLMSKALVPDLQIDYHCKDVPILANHGRALFPEAHFYTDETCLSRQYDLVLASTSLHYAEDWATTLASLATAASGYLFVTGLPIVDRVPSFVFLQRPYRYGYDTEYLGWCLNRHQFLGVAESSGLELLREFMIGYRPLIHRSPAPCDYRGFLFAPRPV